LRDFTAGCGLYKDRTGIEHTYGSQGSPMLRTGTEDHEVHALRDFTAGCGLPTEDWRLGTEDWGLKTANYIRTGPDPA
jgi:hypothetical protein